MTNIIKNPAACYIQILSSGFTSKSYPDLLTKAYHYRYQPKCTLKRIRTYTNGLTLLHPGKAEQRTEYLISPDLTKKGLTWVLIIRPRCAHWNFSFVAFVNDPLYKYGLVLWQAVSEESVIELQSELAVVQSASDHQVNKVVEVWSP